MGVVIYHPENRSHGVEDSTKTVNDNGTSTVRWGTNNQHVLHHISEKTLNKNRHQRLNVITAWASDKYSGSRRLQQCGSQSSSRCDMFWPFVTMSNIHAESVTPYVCALSGLITTNRSVCCMKTYLYILQMDIHRMHIHIHKHTHGSVSTTLTAYQQSSFNTATNTTTHPHLHHPPTWPHETPSINLSLGRVHVRAIGAAVGGSRANEVTVVGDIWTQHGQDLEQLHTWGNRTREVRDAGHPMGGVLSRLFSLWNPKFEYVWYSKQWSAKLFEYVW